MNRDRSIKTAGVIVALALVFAVTPLWSQDNDSGSGHNGRGHMMASPQERTDRLAKALNLSDDQKSKVLSSYQDEEKQMSSLRSDTSMSRQDKWSKMQQIHQATASQIKGGLNPDQAKQFDAMEQKMEEGHHHGGGGMAPQQ